MAGQYKKSVQYDFQFTLVFSVSEILGVRIYCSYTNPVFNGSMVKVDTVYLKLLEVEINDDKWFVSRVNTMFMNIWVLCSLNLIYTIRFYVCIFYLLVIKLGC